MTKGLTSAENALADVAEKYKTRAEKLEAELKETRDRLNYWVKREEKASRELEDYRAKVDKLIKRIDAELTNEKTNPLESCVFIAEMLEGFQ